MKVNFFRYFLIPFSFLYYLISFCRNRLYDIGFLKKHILSAKVISVGNITWGGTGKTPAVLLIAESFLRRGCKSLVLTRGYGNDEQEMLSRSIEGVPVVSGKNRVKNGKEAIKKYSSDIVILDDGFQHRKIERDLNIVCVDAVSPFGNGWVVPVGSLRENISELKRADIFLITKSDLVIEEEIVKLEKALDKVNTKALKVKTIHSPEYIYRLSNDQERKDIEGLKGKKIALLSAIGNPDAFEKTVVGMGLNIKKHFIFRDHHWYKKEDMDKINLYCSENNIDFILTTEKDAVRLSHVPCSVSLVAETAVLKINLKVIENEERFYNRLFGVFDA